MRFFSVKLYVDVIVSFAVSSLEIIIITIILKEINFA